jgi:hypothetical protein
MGVFRCSRALTARAGPPARPAAINAWPAAGISVSARRRPSNQQLDLVFARFDDDKQTSLPGNDVWGALVASNCADGEYFDVAEKRKKRTVFSEVFAAILL